MTFISIYQWNHFMCSGICDYVSFTYNKLKNYLLSFKEAIPWFVPTYPNNNRITKCLPTNYFNLYRFNLNYLG